MATLTRRPADADADVSTSALDRAQPHRLDRDQPRTVVVRADAGSAADPVQIDSDGPIAHATIPGRGTE